MRKLIFACFGLISIASAGFAQELPESAWDFDLSPGWVYNQAFTFTINVDIGEITGPNAQPDECSHKVFRIFDDIPDRMVQSTAPVLTGRVPTAPVSELPAGLTFTHADGPGPDFFPISRIFEGTPTVAQERKTYYYAALCSNTGPQWTTFTIEIIDPNAGMSTNSPPEFEKESDTIRISDIDSGTEVGDPVVAEDPDEGDVLTYSISGADSEFFAIDSTTGQITISRTLDLTEKSEFSVTVTARDESGESDTIDITIEVKIVPELDNEEAAASVLPFLAGEMADQSVDSISGRFERPDSDNSGSGLSGKSAIAAAFFANKEAIANGTRSLGEVLRSVEGTVASSSQDPMSATPNMDWSVWVNGMHGSIKGNAAGLKWDGKVSSTHLGFDVRASADVLVGIQLSLIKGEADFGESVRDKGKFEIDLTAAYPFVGWISPDGNLDMWATAGIGSGDLTVTRNSSVYGGKDGKNDIKTQTFALGVRSVVMESEQTDLHVKASGIVTSMDIKDGDAIAATSVKSNILRIGVEASQKSITKAGDVVAFSEQLSIRHDGGGGSSATGVEIGAGMQFTTNDGLSISTDALALVGSDKLKGWRIGGSVGFDQHRNKHGLSVKLSSEYAQADTAATLDEQLAGTLSGKGNVSDASVSAGIGYGLGLPSGVVMTPFSEVVAASDSRNYRLGTRWEQSSAFSLRLFGEQRETHSSEATHSINLGGEFKF